MANSILRKVERKAGWILEELTWSLLRPIIVKNFKDDPGPLVSIGITTFMDRFEVCLKPVVTKLAALFPTQPIIVAANGHVKKQEQKQYLERITMFCAGFTNVELIAHIEPMGLSHLWNAILNISKCEKALILNDDIRIKTSLPTFIYSSGILDQEIATINRSWSHFLITKSLFQKVGPFDEGLKEIGGEDDDYSARLALTGIALKDFSTPVISGKLKRKKRLLPCNSYGKDMRRERFGYSDFNSEYLAKKWETGMEYFDGAVLVPDRSVRYWKLKKQRSDDWNQDT